MSEFLESKLSPRLRVLYDQLLPGMAVWDVCCDHGYVAFYALASGRFPEVNFVDQVPEIMVELEALFRSQPTAVKGGSIARFFAVSAERLQDTVTGNLLIAGVGAATIIKILGGLKQNQRLQATRLVLAPQNHPEGLESELSLILGATYQRVEQLIICERERSRHIQIWDRI